ncbi:ATP-dependent RNA helicase DDX56/DBP9 [Pycnococcus provasolii]
MQTLGLDPRVSRASLKVLGGGAAATSVQPTSVQAAAIPLLLKGADVVARAPTGTGKTLVYLLPACHLLLTQGSPTTPLQALCLCPTRELVAQTLSVASRILSACGPPWRASAIAADNRADDAPDAPPPPIARLGELVVATPGRVAAVCKASKEYASAVAKLLFLALDEADLLLSYGHLDSIKAIARTMRQGTQCVLVSATAPGAKAKELHALLYRGAEHIDVEANAAEEGAGQDGKKTEEAALANVSHRYVVCEKRSERLAVLASMLKHSLLARKVLVFARNVDECVRLRLSLECFGMSKVALLNATMPLQDRMSCIEQFNRGLFDVLIACDGGTASAKYPKRGADANDVAADDDEKDEGRAAAGAGGGAFDAEYGISRGVDFRDVNTVVHYDMPRDTTTYVHRAGRCGRLGNAPISGGTSGRPQMGVSLSLLSESELDGEWRSRIAGASGTSGATSTAAAAAAAASASTTPGSRSLQEHEATGRIRKLAAALQYRADDVARLITKQRVYEYRKRELRLALLRAEALAETSGAGAKLKDRDRDLLRRTGPLGGNHATVNPELAHFPDYLRGREVANRPARPHVSKRKRDETKRDRAGMAGDRVGIAGKLEAKKWSKKRRKRRGD